MHRTDIAGRLLVLVQFALLAWLIWPFTLQHWSVPALALVASAGLLGLWTLAHNRPGNFNIRPEPKQSGRLVTTGPYRLVRHPMYSAVLLFAAGEGVAYMDEWKALAWFLLLAVLWAKSALEERSLRERYPEYAAYVIGTGRFTPFL